MTKSEVIFLLRATALRDDRKHLDFSFITIIRGWFDLHCFLTQIVPMLKTLFLRLWSGCFEEGKNYYWKTSSLFRAVKNEALNKLRSEKVFLSFSQVVFNANIQDKMDPHEMLMGIELYGQINKLIERLPPKRQQVYRLIKDDGMCYKDVAKLMDISKRTVEVHLKIAVRELRSSM